MAEHQHGAVFGRQRVQHRAQRLAQLGLQGLAFGRAPDGGIGHFEFGWRAGKTGIGSDLHFSRFE